MITDKIEVFLQTRENAALCGTTEEPLNYQEKAFMMGKDKAFQEVVNDWLNSLIASGELIKKFDLHIQYDWAEGSNLKLENNFPKMLLGGLVSKRISNLP